MEEHNVMIFYTWIGIIIGLGTILSSSQKFIREKMMKFEGSGKKIVYLSKRQWIGVSVGVLIIIAALLLSFFTHKSTTPTTKTITDTANASTNTSKPITDTTKASTNITKLNLDTPPPICNENSFSQPCKINIQGDKTITLRQRPLSEAELDAANHYADSRLIAPQTRVADLSGGTIVNLEKQVDKWYYISMCLDGKLVHGYISCNYNGNPILEWLKSSKPKNYGGRG
jgi:hypothetical protein